MNTAAKARAEVPAAVIAERGHVLRRALANLPEPTLTGLAAALENEPALLPGRLYRATAACPIGLLLRDQHPDYDRRGARYWLRNRWRRSVLSDRPLMRECPRLGHLERGFDVAVRLTTDAIEGLSKRHAAAAVGAWMLLECRREMADRTLRALDQELRASREPDQPLPGPAAETPRLPDVEVDGREPAGAPA